MGSFDTSDLRKRLTGPTLLLLATVLGFAVVYWLLGERGLEPNPSFADALLFSIVSVASLEPPGLVPLGATRFLAAAEGIGGLVYIGVLLSRFLSFRQEEALRYLLSAQIVQTFDGCIGALRRAKEELADRRRRLPAGQTMPIRSASRKGSASDPLTPSATAAIASKKVPPSEDTFSPHLPARRAGTQAC